MAQLEKMADKMNYNEIRDEFAKIITSMGKEIRTRIRSNVRYDAHIKGERDMITINNEADRKANNVEMNICCDEFEDDDLFEMAGELRQWCHNHSGYYKNVTFNDICIVIMYTYYALNLTEQIYDLLKPKHYYNIADNRQTIKELHLLLATGDIYMNGENLSSKFRRKMLMGTTAGNNIKDRIARIRKKTGKPVKKRGKSITKGISKTKGRGKIKGISKTKGRGKTKGM